MNKTLRNILIIVVCVAGIAGLFIGMYFSGRVASNPKGTVGNTAGNINNGGMFCEDDGRVYFANSAVGGALYSMNPDETDVKQLNGLTVRNILAGGKYVYFFQTGAAIQSGFGQMQGMKAFERSTKDGKNIVAMTRNMVLKAQLVDDYIYYLTPSASGSSCYKMKTDKSIDQKIVDWALDPACAKDSRIYYNGILENHYLYALNTANDVASEVWAGNLWYPCLDGNYVYYMDLDHDYRICRYSLSQNEIEVLTHDRADCFNVGGGYVYYQSNGKNPQLICMRTDGSDKHPLADGIFTNINMTSRYVYFQPFGDDKITYHSALGSNSFSVFNP